MPESRGDRTAGHKSSKADKPPAIPPAAISVRVHSVRGYAHSSALVAHPCGPTMRARFRASCDVWACRRMRMSAHAQWVQPITSHICYLVAYVPRHIWLCTPLCRPQACFSGHAAIRSCTAF
eukprot:6214836-Pleurochrysis_carterae.AAC.2